MSDHIEVIVLVEGPTEQTFVREVLAPVMQAKNVYMRPALISGVGGDIRFARAEKEIGIHLKQRNSTYITTMFDYYGIDSDWPGKSEVIQAISTGTKITAPKKGIAMENATLETIQDYYSEFSPDRRFIPYIQMHEFEALLFSDTGILADKINVRERLVTEITQDFDTPEDINDSPDTAPSKRLHSLRKDYRKVAMGTAITKAIGIQAIREKCIHFNDWLTRIEQLAVSQND